MVVAGSYADSRKMCFLQRAKRMFMVEVTAVGRRDHMCNGKGWEECEEAMASLLDR